MQNVSSFSRKLKNSAKSIKIYSTPHVTLYREVNYAGANITLSTDTPWLGDGILNFDDVVSSLRLTPNTKVTLYRDTNYKGPSIKIKNNTPHVGAVFIDQVSSVKIRTTRSKQDVTPKATFHATNDTEDPIIFWITHTNDALLYAPIIMEEGGSHECVGNFSDGTRYYACAKSLTTGVTLPKLLFTYRSK